jgi:putative peptidoglycan lipid II flippase
VDVWLASLIPGAGAVAALTYAQLIYTLPVSLFGMSVSASELPEMSRALGSADEIAAILRTRLDAGLKRIAFLVVPSAAAFLALGDVVVALLYQSGRFKHADSLYVWGILAGSTVGLLAATMGRLYSSTWYALHNTRMPLVFAIVRVALTTGLGWLCAFPLPHLLGIEPRWGVAGLTASAGVAGWVEFALLRYFLNKRIGMTGVPLRFVARLWLGAALAAGAGWGIKLGLHAILPALHPMIAGPLILGVFGVSYFAATALLGIPHAREISSAVLRRIGLRSPS